MWLLSTDHAARLLKSAVTGEYTTDFEDLAKKKSKTSNNFILIVAITFYSY
jgi:hypothetical protein